MSWQNMVGRLCLAFALLAGLASCALLGPRLLADISTHGWTLHSLAEGDNTAPIWWFLPFLSASLACAAALIGWRSQKAPAPQTPEIPHSLAAGCEAFQAVIDEMRSLMNDERRRWTELHDTNSTAAREAMVVGVRLAGFAMDAEKRLSVSVEQAELRLNDAATTLQAAIVVADRLERSASEQIAAISEASGRLQQDAISLDQACREIAAVGAGVVARANEAVGLVETGLAAVPELASAIATQTQCAVQALDTASEALRHSAGAQTAAMDDARIASADLNDQVSSLAQAARDHATTITSAATAFTAQTDGLAGLIETLGIGTRALEAAADEIVTVTHNSVASSRAVSEGAGELEAATRAIREESARTEAIGAKIEQACSRGNEAMGALVESLSRRADEITASLKNAGEQFTLGGADAVSSLRDHTVFVSGTLADAGAILRGDADVLSARAQQIDRLLAAVQERIGVFSEVGAAAGQHLNSLAGEFQAEAKNRLHEIAAMIAAVAPILQRFESLRLDLQASEAPPTAEALLREVMTTCARIEGSLAAQVQSTETQLHATAGLSSGWNAAMAEQVSRLAGLQSEMTATSIELSQGMSHVARTSAVLERSEAILVGSIDKVQRAAQHIADTANASVETMRSSAPTSGAVGPLAQLAGVKADAAALLLASEELAEATLSGRPAAIADWITGQVPEILQSVDTVIHQLKSVATAVAIASDAAALPRDRSQVASSRN